MTKAQRCIEWIKDYFADNPEGKAIIGISGGKDSTIAAALCVKALGEDRVIGVLMPNGEQKDIQDSYDVCRELNIQQVTINIGQAYENLCHNIMTEFWRDGLPNIVTTNTPARLRMTVLYMVAGLYTGGRVVNTCNRSEDYVGYSTKFGDAAGDFSPLGNLTVKEVIEIGEELGLPERFVHKTPSDGMCGKSDEENLGFTYAELDDYLIGGKECNTDLEQIKKIESLHKSSRHKYKPMPTFTDDDFISVPEKFVSIEGQSLKRGFRAEGGFFDDCANVSNQNITDAIEPLNFNYNINIDMAQMNSQTQEKIIKEIEKSLYTSMGVKINGR